MTSSNIVAQVQEAIRTESLLEFVRENLEGGNLSIRGVAGLVGVHRSALIKGGDLHGSILSLKLSMAGFQGGDLVRGGFPPVAVWLTIEYFAYESKAEAPTAKAIARVFGAYGVKSAFDLAQPAPSQAHSERAAIDWAAFAEIRRQIESTPDGLLKQILEKTAADLLGQDYAELRRLNGEHPPAPTRKHRSKQPIGKPTKFDHIKDFVEHGAYVVVTDNPEDFVASATLYETYKEYLADYPVLPDNGDHACENINALSKRLSTYLGRSAIQKKVRGKNIRCYPGLLVR